MPPSPSGRDIAVRAQQLKIMFLALTSTLPSILDPSLPILRTELSCLGAPASDDFPMCLYYDSADSGEALTYSTRDVFTKAAKLRGDILRDDLMSIAMLHGGIRLGDMILQGDLSKKPRRCSSSPATSATPAHTATGGSSSQANRRPRPRAGV